MFNISTFQDFYNYGLHAIPVIFNTTTKEVTGYPRHKEESTGVAGVPSMEDVQRWLQTMKGPNGCALKLFPPHGMIDFDLKNTCNKKVYNDWLRIVEANNSDVLRKVCIESTRSGGYHVYIKYGKLSEKIPVARSEGKEVISVYTGGLLSFCTPSPGYQLIHNDFADIETLTDEEFDLVLTTAALFNEDKEFTLGQKTVSMIDYPYEYESVLLQFDEKCTDEVFETLLNSIQLYRVESKNPRIKYVPFLREGSSANYSAKAYFNSKRLLIFSASMSDFPTWHDSAGEGDTRWVLTPSKILYYKNKRSWPDTLAELHIITNSAGINIIEGTPVTNQPLITDNRLRFPYDIFPEAVQTFIFSQIIQHEYLAGAILVALSTAIGNSAVLEAMDGYLVKPILYLSIVAPPGASKSPALKKAFKPLEDFDTDLYKIFLNRMEVYKIELDKYEKDKKSIIKPDKPPFMQTLIKDSTIEMVVKILSVNPMGCCVLADELSGFLARMNQYKAGDEVQKWLEMWSGAPILLQRITREENKVQDPFCNVIGGIQPGVLETLSKEENQHNGFYHRFLFVYPTPKDKQNWLRISVSDTIKNNFDELFLALLDNRNKQLLKYHLNEQANALYEEWFNNKNKKYNKAADDHVKGIIAKYQDYCLRFALLLQVIQDGYLRTGIVSASIMERAIRLTEYFLANMHKATKLLAPETPPDKLIGVYSDMYNKLPQAFTTKNLMEVGRSLKMKDNSIKSFLFRNKSLFTELKKGQYEKNF
jgi:hypothetical protein